MSETNKKDKKIKYGNFKPALTLCVITTIVSTILIISSLFIPDTSGIITDSLYKACVSLMGEGEFELVEDKPDTVNKLIIKNDGYIAFEITTGGYKPPDGMTVLVAMNLDGSILGIVPLKINDDPGIGDRVKNPDFLSEFVGKTDVSQVAAITGATYSSKAVIEAADIAIEVFGELYS